MVTLGILDSSSLQSLSGLDYCTLADVMDIDLSCVLHEGCEGQCLTCGATTVIQDCLLGFAVNSHGQQLTSLVLNLEMALLELSHLEEIAFGRHSKSDAIGSILGRPCFPPHRIKLIHQFLPCGSHGVGSHCKFRLLIGDQ